MPSSNRNSRISRISMLVAIGLILWIFEELIPYPLPFLKLGLGNIVVLFAIYTMKFKYAFLIAILRVSLGALILGRLFSPIFILSISGALSSTLIMIKLKKINYFSIFGISIAGAFMHNTVQMIIAYFLLYRMSAIFHFMPLLTLSSIIGGAIIAFFVSRILSHSIIRA
ncbi:MAG: Gx transporter family protein [Candidatus Zixiibacteriota bacterium]